MKIFADLPFGIVVTIGDDGFSTVCSNLHEEPDCPEDEEACEIYNCRMDAIESMVLAHAHAGIDIESKEYIEGIETAVNACAQE